MKLTDVFARSLNFFFWKVIVFRDDPLGIEKKNKYLSYIKKGKKEELQTGQPQLSSWKVMEIRETVSKQVKDRTS